MSADSVRSLEKLYESVEDIDLFVGMTQETPEQKDSMVGRTFLCLIADGFARLKKGDRFFYDVEEQCGSFSETQGWRLF